MDVGGEGGLLGVRRMKGVGGHGGVEEPPCGAAKLGSRKSQSAHVNLSCYCGNKCT